MTTYEVATIRDGRAMGTFDAVNKRPLFWPLVHNLLIVRAQWRWLQILATIQFVVLMCPPVLFYLCANVASAAGPPFNFGLSDGIGTKCRLSPAHRYCDRPCGHFCGRWRSRSARLLTITGLYSNTGATHARVLLVMYTVTIASYTSMCQLRVCRHSLVERLQDRRRAAVALAHAQH